MPVRSTKSSPGSAMLVVHGSAARSVVAVRWSGWQRAAARARPVLAPRCPNTVQLDAMRIVGIPDFGLSENWKQFCFIEKYNIFHF